MEPSLVANKRIRVNTNRCIYIKRTLGGTGQLSVIKNAEVRPADIIGTYSSNAGFTTINVAQKFGISPNEVKKYLTHEIGKNIYKGELIAEKKNMMGSTVIQSPTDGLLESYDENTGLVTIEFISKQVTLTSGVYGIVEDVNQATREVLIKTLTTQIYGILGSGKERAGILNIVKGAGDIITSKQLDPQMSKRIVVVGSLINKDILRQAETLGINGIVAGGIDAKDFTSVGGLLYGQNGLPTDVGLSTISTEGFGAIPIGEDIFNILKKYEGVFVFLDGNSGLMNLPSTNPDSILSIRKISLPVNNVFNHKPELSVQPISLNSTVRLIWPPFMGSIGKVIAIDKQPTRMESGILTYMLLVETKNNKIKVPFTNIELI